jgi:hypothetical protein
MQDLSGEAERWNLIPGDDAAKRVFSIDTRHQISRHGICESKSGSQYSIRNARVALIK